MNRPETAHHVPVEGAVAGIQDHGARHVAIIMDGNGRWAKRRGVPRALGHRQGVEAVRALVRNCSRLSLEALSLYAFSSENWKRPEDEVGHLMGLLRAFLRKDIDELDEAGIRLRILGDYSAFAPDIVREIDAAVERMRGNQGPILAIALNYGSQDELVRATSRIAKRVADGSLDPACIDRELLAAELDTAGLPPLDLLIRTSGEQRLSNFMLWQCAYAELYFTDVLWPDFTVDDLQAALAAFATRERRYGGR